MLQRSVTCCIVVEGCNTVRQVMPKGGRGAWTASDASLTQIYAAVAPAVLKNKVSGKYFHPIARETVPDPHAANRSLQAHLWKLTEDFLAKH